MGCLNLFSTKKMLTDDEKKTVSVIWDLIHRPNIVDLLVDHNEFDGLAETIITATEKSMQFYLLDKGKIGPLDKLKAAITGESGTLYAEAHTKLFQDNQENILRLGERKEIDRINELLEKAKRSPELTPDNLLTDREKEYLSRLSKTPKTTPELCELLTKERNDYIAKSEETKKQLLDERKQKLKEGFSKAIAVIKEVLKNADHITSVTPNSRMDRLIRQLTVAHLRGSNRGASAKARDYRATSTHEIVPAADPIAVLARETGHSTAFLSSMGVSGDALLQATQRFGDSDGDLYWGALAFLAEQATPPSRTNPSLTY